MILDLGIVDYEEAYRVQVDMVARRRLGEIGDSILLAEHTAVITIGRSGLGNKDENLLVEEEALREYGIKVLPVDRGGDITLHAPGQLVAYPIVDLRKCGMDLHLHMRNLEAAIINCLSYFKIKAFGIPGRTGVWLSRDRKIASIGIAATNWITYHGLSLNVNVDLGYFSMIRLCGFKKVRASSMKDVLRENIKMEDVKPHMIRELSRRLNIENVENEPLSSVDQ